jgi:hypothetical protein
MRVISPLSKKLRQMLLRRRAKRRARRRRKKKKRKKRCTPHVNYTQTKLATSFVRLVGELTFAYSAYQVVYTLGTRL